MEHQGTVQSNLPLQTYAIFPRTSWHESLALNLDIMEGKTFSSLSLVWKTVVCNNICTLEMTDVYVRLTPLNRN